jgi:hypothetical protein
MAIGKKDEKGNTLRAEGEVANIWETPTKDYFVRGYDGTEFEKMSEDDSIALYNELNSTRLKTLPQTTQMKGYFRSRPPDSTILATFSSESRPGVTHTVYMDKEGNVECTCERYVYGHNPCKHMKDWVAGYKEPVSLTSKMGEQVTWILEAL